MKEEDENIKELRKELKKLKPKARVKKLKELEEKKKQDLSQIVYLIKDTEKELRPEEPEAPGPDQENIGKIVAEESGQLESAVKKETLEEVEAPGYIAFKQAYTDYSKIKKIEYASITGSLTDSQIHELDKIGERVDTTKYKSASAEVADLLVASRSTLHKIKKYAGLD